MLEELSLRKFKAFDELKNLKVKPLTILCGVNSAGKTSILKSLLLLKQSYENSSATNEVTLNGLYSINGTMKDVLYKGKGETFNIYNKFIINYIGNKYKSNSKQDVATGKELGKITGLSVQQVSYFLIEVDCKVKKGIVSDVWDTNFLENYSIVITPFSVKKEALENHKFEITLDYHKGGKGSYDLYLKNFPALSGEKLTLVLEGCSCYFSGMRLNNLYYAKAKGLQLSDFLTNVYAICRIVANQYNGFKYLGPLRDNPERQYTINKNTVNVSNTGADTPFLLAKNQTRKISADLFPPLHEDDFNLKAKGQTYELMELVKAWMSYFELGNLDIISQQNVLQLNIKEINIADVGFGVSQVLPIIVQGISLEYEQTFLLEQPEIHLHPRMQMRMADFLISLSQTNHKVIIETHSDHIINRLVRRALEIEGESIIDDIAIYFVNNSVNGSFVEEVRIDKVAGISECPKEFFSQFAAETSHIVQAGFNNITKGRQ
ncbi:hypothetical protein PAESOLCIP111_04759 [Paenibacillus solanacearum]|uniref:Endonuclease GajA/Old nuclease/RecF-like AAA domain-containing protein n=1 Tax=Paenibacillus solanacearum TaxID=2048548 RepID=A0A916K683_9BACL|nr:AAA family ATPase [Paenibacillus solanacearum]CAG7644653.1 hypothetical protein PAESOLCIP111_04759 [Paenibacillus solanacearum]